MDTITMNETALNSTESFRVDLGFACRVARTICGLGGGTQDLAEAFAVSEEVIEHWKSEYDEFRKACEEGAASADLDVVDSLRRLARGHRRQRSKIMNTKAGPVQVKCDEEVPPDLRAVIFTVINRRSHEWKHPSKIVPQKPGSDPLKALYDRICGNVLRPNPNAGLLNNG